MKHVKALSTEKPMKAAEVAWVQLKDIISKNPLGDAQARWMIWQFDNWLQK